MTYLPLVLLFVLAGAFALFSVASAPYVGPRRYNRAKLDAYECGIEPSPDPVVGSGRMENRFRLAHLPIAGLSGEQKTMLDTVIRMVDAQGDELAAADFMTSIAPVPAAALSARISPASMTSTSMPRSSRSSTRSRRFALAAASMTSASRKYSGCSAASRRTSARSKFRHAMPNATSSAGGASTAP